VGNENNFVPCSFCRDREPLHKKGYYYVYTEQGNIKGIAECNCHKEYIRNKKLYTILKNSNLNIQEEEFSVFENYHSHYRGEKSFSSISKIDKYIHNFSLHNNAYKAMLYFCGDPGSQKTYTAKYVGYHLVKKGFSVYYTLMQSLILTISPDFETDSDRKKREFLLHVDSLIIDDSFDKRRVTLYRSGYQLPILESFLKERFDIRRKGIIFVSTVHPKKIEEQGFGSSLENFIVRNTVQKGTLLSFEDIYDREIHKIEDMSAIFS